MPYIILLLLLLLTPSNSYAQNTKDISPVSVEAFLPAIYKNDHPTPYNTKKKKSKSIKNGRIYIALLLPQNNVNEQTQKIANDLLKAAQIALFDIERKEITLIIKDTKGTIEGAKEAAKSAIDEGAKLIIGPLFSTTTKAIAPIVKKHKIPVLSFSNNHEITNPYIWLLGFFPEHNIERIINYASQMGKVSFAALIPETNYGARIKDSFLANLQKNQSELIQIEYYQNKTQSMFKPTQKISQYKERKQAWVEEEERLTEEINLLFPETPPEKIKEILPEVAPELKQQLDQLHRSETFGELPFEAILMPEGGTKLRSLAPLLPYFDIDPRHVQFLGTGLWDDPQLQKEPPLIGGWYAAPNPKGWKKFSKRFHKIYGTTPARLSGLAYDGISLAAKLIQMHKKSPFDKKNLLDPNGFTGLDGIFRLKSDGQNERCLAVLEIRPRRNKIISPAPTNFILIDKLKQHYE